MPSDDRSASVLAALSKRCEPFRSALASTRDELRAFLEIHRDRADDRRGQIAASLGLLGARHLDIERLAGVLTAEPAVTPGTRDVMTRALAVLDGLDAQGDDAFAMRLPPGASLFEATARRLAELGCAMGAGRVAALARGGRYRPAEHALWLESFPFALWSREERRLAPPLVIEVDGSDLRPAGLAEFLDGNVAIVLLVTGDSSPAPLVRLIAPRTFVAQGTDFSTVDRLVTWNGPAIIGIVGERAARFVHDPAAGDGIAARLHIEHLPVGNAGRTGSLTASQQQEELEQLLALRAATVAPAPDHPASAAADPVDKLAAWLLQQADLART